MGTEQRASVTPSQTQPTMVTDDYFRQKVAEGLAEADRGECRPWDVEAMKADLIRRHGQQANLS
jgi:hypothetical protein